MHGELDERYIRARTALLDAVGALAPHLDSIVLVGAQAIYLHTGAAELAVAEFTTDADFTVQSGTLSDKQLIDDLLRGQGFSPREHPGGGLSPGHASVVSTVGAATQRSPGSPRPASSPTSATPAMS